MQAIFSILTVPLMLLNLLGGIVSGVWLAVLGQWWAIGYGIAAIFFSSFVIGLAMMPGLIFAAPAAMLAQKGKLVVAFPLMLLSQFYTYAVIVAWCIFIFVFFVSNANPSSFWPLLIWSYGVALSPLTYMSQREQQAGGGEGSVMTTFFAQIAYVVTAVAAGMTRMTFLDLMILFGGLMLVGMLIQIAIAVAILVEQKRLGLI